ERSAGRLAESAAGGCVGDVAGTTSPELVRRESRQSGWIHECRTAATESFDQWAARMEPGPGQQSGTVDEPARVGNPTRDGADGSAANYVEEFRIAPAEPAEYAGQSFHRTAGEPRRPAVGIGICPAAANQHAELVRELVAGVTVGADRQCVVWR